MSKDLILFEREETSFKSKFYRLMDLLVSNKSSSRMESIILISISYIQLISGFFDEEVGIIQSVSAPDSYLKDIKRIIRIYDLIKVEYSTFSLVIYLVLIGEIVFTIYFLFLIKNITKYSQYTYKEMLVNFVFKFFFYVLFTPILDSALSIFCKQSDSLNASSFDCSSFLNDPISIIICILVLFYSIFIQIMLSLYYNDSNLLSNCFYSRISCNYEIYYSLNLLLFSLILNLRKYLGTLIFLIYNMISSLIMLRFFIQKYPFYDRITSFLIGLFHLLYTWTSLFSIVFYFIKVKQKSILYICVIVILIYMYRNVKETFEDRIFLDTPYHKIRNTNYVLTYVKILQKMIHNVENMIEEKASLIGIIQMHCAECPLSECLAKKKDKINIYLPVTDEWSKINLSEINDKVYLLNFITFVYYFYISQNFYSADLLLNLASYYLIIIGNYCKAIFYLRKAKEMKLTTQESFSYYRLNNLIQKTLTEKLKPSNENCFSLEEMNITQYFKYDDLSQKFFDAISNDVNLNLDFWKILKIHKEKYEKLDLNQLFWMIDRIRKTKTKIENIWHKLYDTYNNFNEMFDLYENYIEQINDDNVVKRELDLIKSKILIQNEQIGMNNQYNLLFDKDTAIVIINGDKGREGLIEYVNQNVCSLFDYSEEELKGRYVNVLMPKIFDKPHRSFIKRHTSVGEKRIIDKHILTYGKNKKNYLIPIMARVKLFPIVGESLYFCGIITKENIDDVILLDSKFNIQGMSERLMQRFGLNNNLFQEIDVPLYLFSKNFLDHYRRNMSEVNLDNNVDQLTVIVNPQNGQLTNQITNTISNSNNGNKAINNYLEDRMNINENSELEFEMKIPNFLKNYTSNDYYNEKISFHSVIRTLSQSENEETNNINYNYDIIVENPVEEEEGKNEEENENLIMLENKTEVPNAFKHMSSHNAFGKEEEKEFQIKINYYRNFFDKKNFDLLEKEIHKLNAECRETFKFLFTFNIYKFGDNNIAYIARCIDNREDLDYSTSGDITNKSENRQEESNNQDQTKKGSVFNKRKYLSSLKNINEVDSNDIEKIKDTTNNFYHHIIKDISCNEMVLGYHDEILHFSRIFGMKDLKMMIDEASSQSSTSSYNEDLMKKAKVQEIKTNILRNVSDFYVFKIIKFLFFGIILITLGFSILIIISFRNISQDSISINNLSTMIYHNTFSIASLVSSLISMKTMYELKLKNQMGTKINFLTFENLYETSDIPNAEDLIDQEEKKYFGYFQFHRSYINQTYDYLSKSNSYIEYNFTKFIPNSATELFWMKVNSGTGINLDSNKTETITLGYPTAYSRFLSFTMELIKSDYFNLLYLKSLLSANVNLSEKNLMNYEHLIKNSIYNPYNYIIPHELSLLNKIDAIFSHYNMNNLRTIYTMIFTFAGLIIFLCLLYAIFLIRLNRNMQDSLERVTKVNLQQIQEIIKSIQNFNFLILNKFRRKENNEIQEITFYNKNMKKKGETASNLEESKKEEMNRKFIFSDEKVVKRLRILNVTYFQIIGIFSLCCILSISIFVYSLSLINNVNKFLFVKSYIYNDLIETGINVLTMKCVIGNCEIGEKINYDINSDLNYTTKETISKQLILYPELNEFYSKKYLLSICDTLFSFNETEESSYHLCVNDEVIKSGNNTNSLIKVIQDSIFAINKEITLNEGNNLINYSQYFENKHFELTEFVYYNYIIRIPKILDGVFEISVFNYNKKIISTSMISVVFFSLIIIVYSLYISLSYINNLIHYLSVARCILKIIPTNVINNTPEFNEWMNKY